MLLLALLICVSPSVLGQLEESTFEDDTDSDLGDFDLDTVRNLKPEALHTMMFGFSPRRVPRQVKTILTKVK